ncbi:MAG: hypothetical protein Q8N88_02075 [Nanoarchaeota archaeon]|nr:hypothetical protein [Nanoarchaeota archaeon]
MVFKIDSTLIFLLLIDIVLFLTIIGEFFAAIWIPTKRKDYERIAKLADLRPGMVFYDLGSGNASLLFYLSKKYNIRCVGIEISPILYLYSKMKSVFFKNVRIRYGNFFKHDLSEADAIYVFLLPRIYEKLQEKLCNAAKNESLIILSIWPFKDAKYFKTSEETGKFTYFLYKKADLCGQSEFGSR